ncbi:MAG: hypothetical protein HFI31_04600 [Lachnospiraceae bacterium]|jgi:hypothetical protein|nr:hypothetical protein [Lachnospiraceae bacterium]MCI8994970.1 hypothetical protein [Lachnospiraceae bacterium]MCI9133456.1 hypothetical protein [Lachnospiraceae bacterium]
MLPVFAVIGWIIVTILLLYLWADVREIKRDLKSCRRDLVRNSLNGRTSENYPGFSEEEYWREAKREQADTGKKGQDRDLTTGPAISEAAEEKKPAALKPGEEQVLREVLAEFLG